MIKLKPIIFFKHSLIIGSILTILPLSSISAPLEISPYNFENLNPKNYSQDFINQFFNHLFLNQSKFYKLKESETIKTSSYTLHLNDYKDNNSFIKNTLYNFSEKQGKELFSSLHGVDITAERFLGKYNHSFTNGNTFNCSIILGYKPIEAWTSSYKPYQKILFSLTHELSHCLLGKEVFLGQIDFEIDISSEQKEQIIKNAVQQSNNSWIHGKSRQNNSLKNPLIIYHETFADLFSLIYLYNYKIFTLNDIENFLNEREKLCKNKQSFCNYQSYKYKNEIINTLSKKPINLQISEIFSISNLFANKSLLENL